MKYLDEYRDGERARQLAREIHRVTTKPWNIMEVCGGQTHAIVKFGIDELLPKQITLIHGPGCPVCVTPLEMIDKAIEIAARPGIIFTSFGDMLRVPGSTTDLLSVKAEWRRRAHCLFAARCRETRGTKSGQGGCFLRRRF
jgi:hydrogenase expression/formation protein HypD